MHHCFRCQDRCECVQGDIDFTQCLCCGDTGDDIEDDESDDEQCPDCGAHFGEEHSLDCAYDDEDDEPEDDEEEDVEDFA